tara:strand:+ start:673 stop:2676 length:2004 start_codon:yes stop_codon:yes gene_type:complete
MIIKQLALENIRSHKSTEIEFVEGKTLIRGDIGSGKSSIMMSIEAALFGKKLKQLIRKGKENGRIELTFEIQDENRNIKKYSVIRKLSTNTQKGGEIIYHNEGNKKGIYSADELSIEITRILGINETAKAQEIFHAFVLARQNELKELVEGSTKKDEDTRTTILMKAFEMEAYKFAIDNAEKLIRKINDVKIRKGGEITSLPEIEKKILEISEGIKKKKNDLEKTIELVKIKKENYDLKKSEYDRVKEERTKITTINTLITSKERELIEKKKEISSNDNKKNVNKTKIEETGKTIEQITKDIENLSTLEELRDNENKITDEITHLKMDSSRKGDETERYEGILEDGKCSTCGREIRDISGYNELISTVNMKKGDIENKINTKNDEKKEIQNTIRETTEMKILEGDLEEIKEIDKKNKILNEKVLGLTNEINAQKIDLKKLPDENELKKSEDKLKTVEEEYDKVKQERTEITTQINGKTNELNENNKSLEKLKQKRIEMENLDDINEWLNKYFMTTVQLIEDYVLDTVNYKFNELFKEWFELLVEDTSKTVRVDEKFNPIIQQNEFEQTFEWLSGGEKAGIALAYRLALNSLIRRQPTGFRPELLMLDEPTDGFSKEQLTKVSNILSDIENKQVIIVSHNQEFVKLDQIISVTKENDISRIDIQSYGD